MSGRAGRRGKDDKGIVIQMLDEKMEPEVTKGMVYGLPDALYSSYHVSYNMVLNMLRVEDADPETLLKASFMQFQQEQQAPALEIKATEMLREAENVQLIPSYGAEPATMDAAALEAVGEYYSWWKLRSSVHSELSSLIRSPERCVPFLQPGRLVYLTLPNSGSGNDTQPCWGWACVVSLLKPKASLGALSKDTCLGFNPETSGDTEHILHVLVEVVKPAGGHVPNASNGLIDFESYHDARARSVRNDTPLASGSSELIVFHASLSCVVALSAIRLQLGGDIKSQAGRDKLLKSLNEVKRRFPAPSADADSSSGNYYGVITNSSLPLLEPIKDLGIDGGIYNAHVARAVELAARMKGHRQFHELVTEGNIAREAAAANSTSTSGSGKKSSKSTKVAAAAPILTSQDILDQYAVKLELIETAKQIRVSASESQSITMKVELKKRMRILRRVGYISTAGVLETKGRFACELNTGDELVLTDMIFEGIFNALTAEQCVALLSCFVHREGGSKATEGKSILSMVREDLQGAYRQLQTIARNVAKVSIDAKLVIDEEEYVNSFNPGKLALFID